MNSCAASRAEKPEGRPSWAWDKPRPGHNTPRFSRQKVRFGSGGMLKARPAACCGLQKKTHLLLLLSKPLLLDKTFIENQKVCTLQFVKIFFQNSSHKMCVANAEQRCAFLWSKFSLSWWKPVSSRGNSCQNRHSPTLTAPVSSWLWDRSNFFWPGRGLGDHPQLRAWRGSSSQPLVPGLLTSASPLTYFGKGQRRALAVDSP